MKSSTNIRELIKNVVPKYKVSIHRDADRYISGISEPERKRQVQQLLDELPDYPVVLEHWDVEKVRAVANLEADAVYRVRIGRHRIVFTVDKKNRKIDVPEAFLK